MALVLERFCGQPPTIALGDALWRPRHQPAAL